MRSREFTINIPITVSISGDDDPKISVPTQNNQDNDTELQQNPVMVSPQQQELEIKKAELGKTSPVIDKLIQPSIVGQEQQSTISEKNKILDLIKLIMNKSST